MTVNVPFLTKSSKKELCVKIVNIKNNKAYACNTFANSMFHISVMRQLVPQ